MARNGKSWVLPTRKNIFTDIVEITPTVAVLMLAYHQLNRPLAASAVARLALKMKEGRFLFTHQGIAFSNVKTLLDGQHRLRAIAESGVSVMMNVTYNLPPETFKHMDVDARQRTAADFLGIMHPDLRNKSLVAGTAHAMMRGIKDMHLRYPTETVALAASDTLDIVVPLVQIMRAASPVVRRAPVIGAFAAAVRKGDAFPGPRGYREPDVVHLAAMRLAEEEWTGRDDPMKKLKGRMERAAVSKRGEQITSQAAYALTVSALRAALKNVPLNKITTTEIDWGDKHDSGGPLSVKRRPSLDGTRLAARRAEVHPIPGPEKAMSREAAKEARGK